MDRIIYKGVLCVLGTYRVMNEDKPALYCADASDWQNVYEAGFGQEKELIRRENGKRNGRWEVLVKL